MEENVIWRDVVSENRVFVEAYQANSLGEVWSKDRYIIYKDGSKHLHKGKKLKPFTNTSGYFIVELSYNGFNKKIPVHRIISDCFPDICGTWFPGAEPDHLNGNKLDQRPENLKYKSHKDNCNNQITLERLKKVRREESYKEKQRKAHLNRKDQSKPVIQLTKNGEFVAEYPSAREAGRRTGIFNTNISTCCRGKVKTAGGFLWSYR